MRRLVAILLFGLALGLPVAGRPAAPPAPAPSNEECLGCHQDKGLTKTVKGKPVSLFADPAILQGSVHRPLQCVDCHAGIKELPHAENLPPVNCATCHGDAGKGLGESIHGAAGVACQACHGTHGVRSAALLAPTVCRECHQPVVQAYQAGVHGQAVAHGVADAAKCRDCHGPAHLIRPGSDPGAPTNRTRMAETCGHCHADRALVERRQIPIPQAYQLYQKSVHGRAVASGRAAATCNDCHADHDIRRATDPRSQVYRENIPTTCGRCHGEEARVYLQSIHGTAMLAGASESPVCIDCHGEHSIRGTQDPDSPVSVARVTRTCASCHEVQRITEKYGIPGQRLATYADSYHGLAARGGSLVAANCASCHGFHDIRPSRDPRSSVNPANLPATCGKCHP
ncbi:MAG TPA: hypothetical protein VMG58_02370, partial [Candidatus Sulfotelmatobacter sp.]|nr:hypothetical protein [Candidatus Sulfotelmatobacter sp.]